MNPSDFQPELLSKLLTFSDRKVTQFKICHYAVQVIIVNIIVHNGQNNEYFYERPKLSGLVTPRIHHNIHISVTSNFLSCALFATGVFRL